MDDEWTLETTFAGAISQQIGLDLIQSGQGSATGTTGRSQQQILPANSMGIKKNTNRFKCSKHSRGLSCKPEHTSRSPYLKSC